MDKNTTTGFLLIFLLILGYQYFMSPSEAEISRQQAIQDSLNLVEQQRLDNQVEAKEQEVIPLKPAEQVVQDSLQQLQFQGRYGSLAHLVQGSEQETVIENDVIKVTFTNKGGRVKEVLLKEHFKLYLD